MQTTDVTIATYDASAEAFAEKFSERGARREEIDIAFELLGPREKIRALELGCGYGRDGEEIAKRVDTYRGIDASKGFIDLAKRDHPSLSCEIADMRTYEFTPGIDIVFAFASFLHLSPEDVRDMFRKIYAALTPGGIVMASLQEGDGPDLRDETLGTRLFYLYTRETFRDAVGAGFDEVYYKPYTLGTQKRKWFEVAFRKN